jgi:RNA polymerase sigma factor (sigma-70 family)
MSKKDEGKISKKQPKMTEKSRKMMENNIGIIKNALKGKIINEDILQDIYLQLCSKMTRYDSNLSKISTFLHLHSRWSNLDSYNRLNSKRNLRFVSLPDNFDIADDSDDPHYILEKKEELNMIREKIESLPLVAKIILSYYMHLDNNIQKVCKELRITRNIVHQQLELAYTILVEEMKGYYDA